MRGCHGQCYARLTTIVTAAMTSVLQLRGELWLHQLSSREADLFARFTSGSAIRRRTRLVSTVYETVYEKHPETCYRTVYETQYRDEQ